MPQPICDVSGCNDLVQMGQIVCYGHMLEYEEGELDECPQCDVLKYVEESVCGDCDPGVEADPDSPGPGAILAWEPEPDDEGLDEPERAVG